MRLSRVLGPTLALILVASAATGAATASGEAGVMCQVNEAKCAEKNRYPVETEFNAQPNEGKEVIFESSEWKTWCTATSLGGLSTSLTAGKLTTLSFASCKPLKKPPGIKECFSQETLNLPYSVEFATNEAEEFGVERLRLTSPTFKFNCQFGGLPFWCRYSEKEVDLVLTGGSPALLLINRGLLKLTEFSSALLCSTEIAWYAEYTVSEPSPLFFRAL